MKHKHADLIHAWADGAEIQLLSLEGEWQDALSPAWYTGREYRIKPSVCQNTTNEEKKPVVRWLWAHKIGDKWIYSSMLMTEQEASERDEPTLIFNYIKLEWSRTEFPE